MKRKEVTALKDRLLEVKKEEIVRVAGERFFEKGYTQTSMEEIAATLSIGKPSIYAQFPSKADLLAEVCNRTTAYAAALAKEAVSAESSPSERLRYIVQALCLRVIEGRFNLAVLFRETKHLPPKAVKKLAANFHDFNRSLDALLREGVDKGEFSVSDPGVVTHAISGMATWIYAWYRQDGSLSPQEISQKMADLALMMVDPGRRPTHVDSQRDELSRGVNCLASLGKPES